MRHNAIQQRSLDLKILSDCLDDPVALLQLRQVVFKIAGSDHRRQRRFIKRRRLGLRQPRERRFRQPIARSLTRRNHIKQKRRNASVGQVRRNARAHGSRAQNRGTAHQQWLGGKPLNGSGGRGDSAHAWLSLRSLQPSRRMRMIAPENTGYASLGQGGVQMRLRVIEGDFRVPNLRA